MSRQYRLTQDEPQRFTTAFNFLSASKNAKCDDVKLEASFVVLGELPIESGEAAAKVLAKEANSFMPDDGSWFEVADTHASEALLKDVNEVRQITPGRDIEQGELAATKLARDEFVRKYEALCGKRLPSTHPWKADITGIRTVHCVQCSDVGWKSFRCTRSNQCLACQNKRRYLYAHEYVDKCVCFENNPALTAARAEAQLRQRRRANQR